MVGVVKSLASAVSIGTATGRNLRALNSGIISSTANITPPIGVLKVAAMPAPAPAATSVTRCRHPNYLSEPGAEGGADLGNRAFAAGAVRGLRHARRERDTWLDRAQIDALVEQAGVDFGWSQIDKPAPSTGRARLDLPPIWRTLD